MTTSTIFCPGGSTSQSGAAVMQRYPDAEIESCGGIASPLETLDTNSGPYVIPIWNSHEGQVHAANYVWELIQQAKIKISDLWAKQIEFLFLQRTNPTTNFQRIGSVKVARTQCSGFIAEIGAEFAEYSLTTVAYEECVNGAQLDGVLVAPNHIWDKNNFSVTREKTANPNNFTSFVSFASAKDFSSVANPTSWLTGVSMGAFSATMGEAETLLFRKLVESINHIKDIPNLAFVFKHDSKVGLLFEGPKLANEDLLDAETIEAEDLIVYEEVGSMTRTYSKELEQMFKSDFADLITGDFIHHQGVKTCLFVCPALGLFTHGYSAETVEPIFRFYISELFRTWDQGTPCTPSQQTFFERYADSWRNKFSEFIEFSIVSKIAE